MDARQPQPLEATERRITEHLRRLLGVTCPVPAITLVQAPVFHAHTFSIYIEMAAKHVCRRSRSRLAGEHVQMARAPEDSPSNVNVAGKDEIMVAVRRDAVHENGFWLWAAVDNLRLVGAHRRRLCHRAGRCTAAWKSAVKLALAIIFLLARHCTCRALAADTTLPATPRACRRASASIAVPMFVNQTQTYRIEQMLTRDVVRELLARTHYHIVNDARPIC